MNDFPKAFYLEALNSIDPVSVDEDYNAWAAILWGCKAAGLDYDTDVDPWCSRGGHYDYEENKMHWDNDPDAFEVGPLIEAAKRAGWDNREAMKRYGSRTEAAAKTGKTKSGRKGKMNALPEHVLLFRPEELEEVEVPPAPTETEFNEQIADYLQTMFQASEFPRFVTQVIPSKGKEGQTKYSPGIGTFNQRSGRIYQTLETAQNPLAFGRYQVKAGVWIGINPTDGKGNWKEPKNGRAGYYAIGDENITDCRYALLESDKDSIGKQLAIYKALRVPAKIIVHSGNKSAHAIIHIDAGTDQELYRRRVQKLFDAARFHGLTPDNANKNPSRLSRLPGVFRGQNVQYILGKDWGFPDWESWEKWYDSEQLKAKNEVLDNREETEEPEIIFGDPVPFDEAYSNPFPVDSLEGPYKPYCIDAAKCMCQPVDQLGVAMLAAVSAVISKVVKIEVNGKEEHTNLMLLLAADPSEKKSATLNKAQSLILNFEMAMNEELKEIREANSSAIRINDKRISGLERAISEAQNDILNDTGQAKKKPDGKDKETREEVKQRLEQLIVRSEAEIKKLRDKNASLLSVNTNREYLIDSGTPEGIRDALISSSGRMAIFSDEGGLFKSLSGLYSKAGQNADTDIIKKGWDGTAYRARRVGKDDGKKFITQPILTMCLYIQPHVVTAAYSNKEWDEEGLLARFLISKPNTEAPEYRKRLGLRQNPWLREDLEKWFNELINYTDDCLFGCSLAQEPVPKDFKPFVLHLSPDGYREFNRYYDLLEDRAQSPDGKMYKSVYRKHAFVTLRLIAAVHMMKYGPKGLQIAVEAETVLKGIDLGEYFLSGQEAVRGGAGGSARLCAERIVTVIQNNKKWSVDRPLKLAKRDITNIARSKSFKTSDLETGYQYLLSRGWIVLDEEEKKATYFIHPDLYDLDINTK